MSTVILGVTLSLDGFAEDINGSVGPLYPDIAHMRESELLKESIRNTGAVVMSWKEFKMPEDPDTIADNYEYQVPIFVYTRELPVKHPKENDQLRFTFVTSGVRSAVEQARLAAKNKDVTIIGSAGSVHECLEAGVADELRIEIIPILLKQGFRPFDNIKSIKLERLKVLESGERTHIRYRIIK